MSAVFGVNSKSEQIDSRHLVNCQLPSSLRGQSEWSVLFGQLSRGEMSGLHRPGRGDRLMDGWTEKQIGKEERGTVEAGNNAI